MNEGKALFLYRILLHAMDARRVQCPRHRDSSDRSTYKGNKYIIFRKKCYKLPAEPSTDFMLIGPKLYRHLGPDAVYLVRGDRSYSGMLAWSRNVVMKRTSALRRFTAFALDNWALSSFTSVLLFLSQMYSQHSNYLSNNPFIDDSSNPLTRYPDISSTIPSSPQYNTNGNSWPQSPGRVNYGEHQIQSYQSLGFVTLNRITV